ncbi:MAG: DUF2232 domain-containing protein [Bacillota bacterium]|jgi:hypothetical protein
MKLIYLSTQDLHYLGRVLLIYVAAILIGSQLGWLPFVGLAAGLPALLIGSKHGTAAAIPVALICLLAVSWIVEPLDLPLLGSSITVALVWCYAQQRRLKLPESLPLVLGGVFLWLALASIFTQIIVGESLLAATLSGMEQEVARVVQNFEQMEGITPEQIEQVRQLGDTILELARTQWGYLIFHYAFFSLLVTQALGRILGRRWVAPVNWWEAKAPPVWGSIALALFFIDLFWPGAKLLLLTNLYGIFGFTLVMSGLCLVFFYLRHFRFTPLLAILVIYNLFLSPTLWRIMFLVGCFDSLFDYRYYARAGGQGNSQDQER